MELDLNNNINNKRQENKEITDFINELSSTLERKQELVTYNNLYNEILKDVELALKYKNRLSGVISKCLENLSYERDFFYFDYDKRRNEYCLKYYWNGGNTICDKLNEEDIKEFKRSGYTFFEPFDENGTIRESDTLKDWMKCEVKSALLDFEIKKQESKGK